MKNKKLALIQQISNASSVPFDAAGSLSYIHLLSNREALIEDAGRLVHYDSELVTVKQGKNSVTVTGSGLVIKYLKNNNLSVTGFIRSVSFE